LNYKKKIDIELREYENNINIHNLPQAAHYYHSKYVNKEMENSIGISSFEALVIKYINLIKQEKPEKEIKLLSLGSGNCDIEINLALSCNFQGEFYCYELNPKMLERAKQNANERGINNFIFIQDDINKIKIQEKFDIVLAIQSLHHFVELEHIFDEVNGCMTEKSFFIINDMIGRNGHMFWENSYYVYNAIWNILPKELKYNHITKKYYKKRKRPDFWGENLEGIRAQDILPLLDRKFKFVVFAPFSAVVNFFTNRDFGYSFDLNNDLHLSILDMLCTYDNFLLKNKLLKPTQLLAAMAKKDAEISEYKYLYFENPKDAYIQDEKKIYNYFDYSIFTILDYKLWEIVKPFRNLAKKIYWRMLIKK